MRETPPDLDRIADLADQALAAMPSRLSRHVRDVGIHVEDLPDDDTLEELGIESAWDLTGLYRGVPFGQRSIDDLPRPPDLITLYRQPILLEWIETGESLPKLVASVLIHEIAHHFGFSDEEIAALEQEAVGVLGGGG